MAEDRNQTIKKQLLKKREETAKKKIPLAPGEMVDDALARGLAGGSKWLKKNFGTLQWVFVAAVAAGIGYAVYDHQMDKRAQQASAALMKGTASEAGRISGGNAPPKPPGEEGIDDPTPVFKTADERRDTALASYRKVVSNYPGTGAAILARMGEAGLALDHRDWDLAVTAYNEVKDSALAKADPTVRGRALEGIGLALEGKGDTDGALKSFRDLENNSITGLKELGMYHQARILFAKGDTDKPKELLKSAREKLKNAASGGSGSPGMSGEMHPFAFLESQIDDLLRRIDPSAVPSTPMPGMSPGMPGRRGMGGGDPRQLTPEKMRELQEQLRKQLEDANKEPPVPAPAGSK